MIDHKNQTDWEVLFKDPSLIAWDDPLLKEKLTQWINDTIQKDFNALIHWLYQLDVDESVLKQTLKSNPETDAGALIADLAIKRAKQKRFSKEQSKNNGTENWEWI
jgi:hypothetical protein